MPSNGIFDFLKTQPNQDHLVTVLVIYEWETIALVNFILLHCETGFQDKSPYFLSFLPFLVLLLHLSHYGLLAKRAMKAILSTFGSTEVSVPYEGWKSLSHSWSLECLHFYLPQQFCRISLYGFNCFLTLYIYIV